MNNQDFFNENEKADFISEAKFYHHRRICTSIIIHHTDKY